MNKITSRPEEWDFTGYDSKELSWIWQYEILRELRLYRNKENVQGLKYHDGLVRAYFDDKDIRLGLADLCLRPWGALDDFEKDLVRSCHDDGDPNSPFYSSAIPGPLRSGPKGAPSPPAGKTGEELKAAGN